MACARCLFDHLPQAQVSRKGFLYSQEQMMGNSIQTMNAMQLSLAKADTPDKTRDVEAAAGAAKAWAKEQGDYEMFVAAAHVYIMARRKTTELIKPNILHGSVDGLGNNDVTLADYGFTKMQWHRRVKELSITEAEITEYFDQCISAGWEPTLFGLWKFKEDPHVSHNSGENEWYTPVEYIARAILTMGGIDLDPASSKLANKTVGAAKFYSLEDDGLSKKWSGRVWMNPPYAAGLVDNFIKRYAEQVASGDVSEGIVLVNNATETEWFGNLISVSKAVCFPNGRIKFIDKQGAATGSPLQGQAIVYAGKNKDKFLKHFGGLGWMARIEA